MDSLPGAEPLAMERHGSSGGNSKGDGSVNKDSSNDNRDNDELTEAEILALVAEIERKERENADAASKAANAPPTAAAAAAAAARPPPSSLYEELVRYQEEHVGEEEKLCPPQQRREQSDGQNSSSEDDRKPAAEMPHGIYRQPLSRSLWAQRGSSSAAAAATTSAAATTGTQGQETAEAADTTNSATSNDDKSQQSNSAAAADSGAAITSQPQQQEQPRPGSLYEELRQQALEVRKETLAEAAAMRIQMEDDEETARRVQREGSGVVKPRSRLGEQSLDKEEEALLRQLSGLPIGDADEKEKEKSLIKNINASGGTTNKSPEQIQLDRDIEQQRRMLETFQRQKEQKEMEMALKMSKREPVSKKELEEDWAKLRRSRRPQPAPAPLSQVVSLGSSLRENDNSTTTDLNSSRTGLRLLPPIASEDGSSSQNHSHQTSLSSHSHSNAGGLGTPQSSGSNHSQQQQLTPHQQQYPQRRHTTATTASGTPYYPPAYAATERGVDRGHPPHQRYSSHQPASSSAADPQHRPVSDLELLHGLRRRPGVEAVHYPMTTSRSVGSAERAARERGARGDIAYYPSIMVGQSTASLDRGHHQQQRRQLPGDVTVPALLVGDDEARYNNNGHDIQQQRGEYSPPRTNRSLVGTDHRLQHHHHQLPASVRGTPPIEVRVPARLPYERPQPLGGDGAPSAQAPGEGGNVSLQQHHNVAPRSGNSHVMARRNREANPSQHHPSGVMDDDDDDDGNEEDRYRSAGEPSPSSGPGPSLQSAPASITRRSSSMNSERSERDEFLEDGLRTSLHSVQAGDAHVITCVGCSCVLQTPGQHQLVYCPNCGVVNPCG